MKALEVFVNGQRLCLAGVGSEGVLTATVDWAGRAGREDVFMHVGGLDGVTDESLEWAVPRIDVGTEITIRVVEVASVDPPSKRTPPTPDDTGDDD